MRVETLRAVEPREGSKGFSVQRFLSPAAGDDAGAFFGVGYGDGADGGSVPEGFGFGFVVVDGVVGGFDVDAG